MGLYISVLRQPGMALPDRVHLNAEGCKKVATALAGMLYREHVAANARRLSAA